MKFFVLIDPAAPDQAVAWWEEGSARRGGPAPLNDIAKDYAEAEADQLVAVIAGTAAVARPLSLPMKRLRDAERAANLALQESLAQPIESPVLALGPDAEGERLAALMAEGTLREVLASLQEQGLDPDVITIDQAMLPRPDEGKAFVYNWSHYSVVRTPDVAFTAEATFVSEVLGAEALECVELAAEELAPDGLLNFRVGALRKRKPLPDLKAFRTAAATGIAAGLLFLAGTFIEAQRYGSAAKQLRAEAESAFSATFPGTPIVDLERQMQGQSRVTTSSDFLVLAAVLTDVLEERETARLRSVTYRDDGELAAEVSVTAIADLEAIGQELSAKGVIVQEGSDVRGQDGAFITRLFLRAS